MASERRPAFSRVHLFASEREQAQRARERLERMLHAAGFELGGPPRSPTELVVSLGGDGTLLDAIRRFLPSGAAFIGINAGHLGFLQEAEEDNLVAVVDRLQRGRFHIIEERLLEVAVAGAAPAAAGAAGCPEPRLHHALNDVVVERRDTRTLRLAIRIDGRELGPIVADGLLVATPLGSTAYAFAAGGAIVHPAAPVLQVVAINPHRSRLTRGLEAPLIVPDAAVLAIDVDWGRARTPRLVLDGEEVPLAPHELITVRRSARSVRLVRLGSSNFVDRLRTKLS